MALIVRNLAFEYRGKRNDDAWRSRWDLATIVGSYLPAVLWGVAFGNIVAGVPIDENKEFTGNLFTLLNPYALLAGAVTLTLFLTHGAMFVALKTDGDIRHRARALSVKLGLVAAVVAVVFLVWTLVKYDFEAMPAVLFAVAAVSLLAAILMATRDRRAGPSSGRSSPSSLRWPDCSGPSTLRSCPPAPIPPTR